MTSTDATVPAALPPFTPLSLHNPLGVQLELWPHGALGSLRWGELLLNLFPGQPAEAGPGNLWLRQRDADGACLAATPLLGPASPLGVWQPLAPTEPGQATDSLQAQGEWQGLALRLQLRLASDSATWFWHLAVCNQRPDTVALDLLMLQDLALAPEASVRLNEHYVSHYVDQQPLPHADHGWLLAARQNLAAQGRHPWALAGSLRRATAYATDGWQVFGVSGRSGQLPPGVVHGLPAQRLQHEHTLLALQDTPLTLAPAGHADLGFFVHLQADHPAASGPANLACVATVRALPQARPAPAVTDASVAPATVHATARPMSSTHASLFVRAPWWPSRDLGDDELQSLWPGPRRHEEQLGDALGSFFSGAQQHVVLRAKELAVQRPHGHILRSGQHLVPDETALTSTVWMGGVFHSMLTQGHVAINRCLSTVRGWLGQNRSAGLRLFVDDGQGWQQLGLPSAFEMAPDACRWLYAGAQSLIEVRSSAHSDPHTMALQLRVLAGPPVRVLASLEVALAGDDGRDGGPAHWRRDGDTVWLSPPPGSLLDQRFPGGGMAVVPTAGTVFESVGGDGLLYADGMSRGQGLVVLRGAAGRHFGLQLQPRLVQAEAPPADPLPLLQWTLPSPSLTAPAADGAHRLAQLGRLAEVLPWFQHNALVHYLAPRGLEQYSGGGWGTRDVCQGPLEMLLALGRTAPVRDLLCRVFAAQNVDGDWPQWFMFFDRDRDIRAGDSHGDIVFWPLLGLARYLLASGDATLLAQPLPFHGEAGAVPVWQHVQRALALVQSRRIAGTALAAYGHGDWNDSLQPADPALREHLCSSWTVTLHHEMLSTLARALQRLGRGDDAAALAAQAEAVQADFQRLLVVDGVVSGYALFNPGQAPQWLLHPRDERTGLRHSLLPMMHAVLANLLSPAQARQHAALIEQQLKGPDGARLFDRPLAYRGGLQQLFQRGESSAFFGREIGVMYMHAHLRYCEMLAHLGQAEALLDALSQAHPVDLRRAVPNASPRQANCYYSSSDAAFPDRYAAQGQYEDIGAGQVALDGGWRVYSSGPGIAIGLVVGRMLGLRPDAQGLLLDPVLAPALAGLVTEQRLDGRRVRIRYHPGAQGFGPTALVLNGQALAFDAAPNPYRQGGAYVPWSDCAARWRPGLDEWNELTVHTG